MVGIYFSGTGNTKYILGQLLLDERKALTYSILDTSVLQAMQKEEEIVLAYPANYFNFPVVVGDFICKHKDIWNGKKVYVLVTMGAFCGDGTGCAARLLKKYGASIWGGLVVRMPDCISDKKQYVRTAEFNQKLVDKAIIKVKKEREKIKAGKPSKEGLGVGAHLAGLFGGRLWSRSFGKQYFTGPRIDNQKCVGCGKCASICEPHNIEMENGKPVYHNKCTRCYHCVNECPQQALTFLGDRIISQHSIEKYIHSC